MKTPPASRISPQTRAAVAAILDADKGISPAHRLAILTACDKAPAMAPTGAEMPAQEAGRILGKSLTTVLRWIAAGKLEGHKVGARLWVVSSASVEAMRAALVVPARQPIPIPDLLAHLAPRLKASSPAKPARKSRRG